MKVFEMKRPLAPVFLIRFSLSVLPCCVCATLTDWDSCSIPNRREGVVLARFRGRGTVTMTTGLSPSVGGRGLVGGAG